jgi:hypothetical protein
MSHCPNCGCDLPGFQTLCQKCYAESYAELSHPQPWWQRIVFRITLPNVYGFLFLFVYSFLQFRFDFPYLHPRHYQTTANSIFFAALFASVAFLEKKKLT